MDLQTIKEQLKAGSISLSNALQKVWDETQSNLSQQDREWLSSELNGYEMSEDRQAKVSGFTSDAGDEFPEYRKLAAYKTIASRPETGEQEDASGTTYHKLKFLEIQSIPVLEKTVRKLIASGEHISTRLIQKGVQFDKYIMPDEYKNLRDSVQQQLITIIDKHSTN